MIFLLTALNAKYIHINPAVYSLRAYAGSERRAQVRIAEYTVNQPAEEILADIVSIRPDAVGFSCYIWNWRLISELITELPKLLPETAIWLGGPEVSFDPERILGEWTSVTGIMLGEGEETFRELLDYYHTTSFTDRSGLSGIRGIVFRGAASGGRNSTVHTGYREPMDINALAFPYERAELTGGRILYYESIRGCPYRCSYCLSSVDKTVRLRRMELVRTELQVFLDARVKQVKFVDRTFNCNNRHAVEVWTYLAEHDNGVTNFHFEIAADLLTEKQLELLEGMRPGFIQLEIGVQTVNPDTLQAINRRTDRDRLQAAVERLRSRGNIHLHLDLIAGLPLEDFGSFRNSFQQVYAMGADTLQLGFLKVLKGSPLESEQEKYGIRHMEYPPYEVLCTDALPYDKLRRLKGVEQMLEIYGNSGQFRHTIRALCSVYANPFDLFDRLSEDYRQQGYHIQSPSRQYRYDILFRFCCLLDPEGTERYRELLTFDLFLRENVKSRPGFAAELAPHKEDIRGFYEEEEEKRRYLPDYVAYAARQMSRMTHLEPFSYPVWKDGGGSRLNDPVWILFDYRTRNPVTGDAGIQILNRSVKKARRP